MGESPDLHAGPAARDGALPRRLFAEVVATFFLVLVDAGGAVIAALSHGEVTPAARSIATGLLVLAMIHAVGDVSGAHLNPAVTLAFALRRVFPWARVPLYWGAQLAGAALAALLLRAAFGDVEHLGATLPRMGLGRAVVFEALLTMLLVSVVLGTATRHRVLGGDAALACGGTVALCGLFARPVSGASMNPARSLGPALVSGDLSGAWVYVVGPAAGAAAAVLCMQVIHRRRHREEREAAAGEEKR